MANIKTYFLVARNTWDEALTYRLNFAVWRLRVFLSLISTYFLWLTLLPQGASIANYNQSLMLTYIVGGAIIYAIVMSTRAASVADDIVQGNLSNYLIRPVNYIWYYFSKDIGDKAMNIVFSLIEVSLVFILLHPPFFLQTNMLFLFSFFIAIIFAVIINFYMNMLLSFIGFFSSEAWAPRFIFFILLSFFAGSIFPLDILPYPLYFFLKLLPFSYLIYAPMKIYLGQLPLEQILFNIFLSGVWIVLLRFFVAKIWQKGLSKYSAEGK